MYVFPKEFKKTYALHFIRVVFNVFMFCVALIAFEKLSLCAMPKLFWSS